MTKKQREDFEAALKDIEQCAFSDCCTAPEPPAAASVASALRILSARLDDIEVMAKRAIMHTKGC